MKSKTGKSQNKQNGVSLIELLFVVAILGVLIALAVPSFSRADVHFQRQNVTRQLKTYLERARFDSIKRNANASNTMAKVIIHNATSFSSALDLNYNGTIETSEIRLISDSSRSGVKIVGGNLVFPITISFNHRGQATATNGSSQEVTPTFVVCEQNCTSANANQTNSNTISISPTGTVALVQSGQTFFDRLIPNVTAIGTGSKINSMAQVND